MQCWQQPQASHQAPELASGCYSGLSIEGDKPRLAIDSSNSDLITAYLLHPRRPSPEPIAPEAASLRQWALLLNQAIVVAITVATGVHMPRGLANAVIARRRYLGATNWSN